MTAQSYRDPIARNRMEDGRCPECGDKPEEHGGWGTPRCSLTDNGVAQRIAQYQRETSDADQPEER